ncbi:GtrA family protein [Varunaivibrio sulfuroxidans]|uniref:Putative flippase GtrA n=1 Tax=Varunaivibrio sulfuroxidans TaxID=1773489 RepID=A0A4R3JBA1_9PROT|nr:GtrA family protein [Varunaivibrio sulfuroxidans]TCS62972.1 putative flippase GtrA [Varunaivibrio sulfuroxidans]WES31950.1 GtrA family protein [Varunaivibrio sulfuroxidans]
MSSSLVMYIVVGGVGFVIDGGIMSALHGFWSWSPMAARAVSFPAAVSATWMLNRHWTFGRGGVIAPRRRYGPYVAVQVIGALINLGVFALAVRLSEPLAAYPIMALAVAAVPALGFTYGASRFFVFRQPVS